MKVKTQRPKKEGAEGRVAHDFSFASEVLVGDAEENVWMPLKAFMVLKLVVFDDCAPYWY